MSKILSANPLLTLCGLFYAALAFAVAHPASAQTIIAFSPLQDGDTIASFSSIGGTISDNLEGGTVTFSIRENNSCDANRWWNGSEWQEITRNFLAVLAETSWSVDPADNLPPVRPGASYTVFARASLNSSSATANIILNSAPPILSWDPGLTHAGTEVQNHPDTFGGSYLFKIVSQNPASGAWRTALNVTSGEANLYMRQGSAPTPSSFSHKSDRAGSDGFVLHSSQFSDNQEWFILVCASEGAEWNLVSGEAFVHDLGPLQADASSGANVVVGAEGYAFFKTTIPAETLAWRLWLNGAPNDILVKKSGIPLTNSRELQQASHMLVVPDYLGAGTFEGFYFVGVPGVPGSSIELDSRAHAVTTILFENSLNAVVNDGFPYSTYRVQVPVEQIAWQINAVPLSGNPNIAVRRDKVPNQWNNDAFSELAGTVTDSITLVPPPTQSGPGTPGLSDGAYYITVYGEGPHRFNLINRPPTITDIDFPRGDSVIQVVNDELARSGWRFYRMTNYNQQIGSLGWEIVLSDHVPGTEIALRQNDTPGRWNSRPNDGSSSTTHGHADFSSTAGFLQRQGHQSDFWYIGIYSPTAALGPFKLSARDLIPAVTPFDGEGNAIPIENQLPGRWQYFKFEVPDSAMLWDLRLENITSGDPRLVIRRDKLPDGLTSHADGGGYWSPTLSSSWPNGYQHAPTSDLSGYGDRSGQILQAPRGNPLEPGTYYVGVLNSASGPASGEPMSYTLVSRGVGDGLSILIHDLAWDGGTSSRENIDPREVVYYRIEVPENAPSWTLKLSATTGESQLLIQRGRLPGESLPTNNGSNQGQRMQKVGDEFYTLLPESNGDYLDPGTYYLAVIGEGAEGINTPWEMGAGISSFTLQSLGPVHVITIGAVDQTGETDLIHPAGSEGGESKFFQFTVPEGTLALEVRLENRVGSPVMYLRSDRHLPRHYGYGMGGGASATWSHADFLNIANPVPGTYSMMVNAASVSPGNTYPSAEYQIRVHAIGAASVSFDAGAASVGEQAPGTWRYFRFEVPENALGWDLRLENITSGAPQVFVRRGELPDLDSRYNSTNPTLQVGSDLSGHHADYSGVARSGQIFQAAVGSRIQPGIYYIGILNDSSSPNRADPMTYELVSRGIGPDMTIPVQDLAWADGSHSVPDLLPRDAAYYRVQVPADAPSWKVKLSAIAGESQLLIRRSVLPEPGTTSGNHASDGKRMQKEGGELYVMLPEYEETTVPAGTYYLAVVGEGVDPENGRTGTGVSSYTVQSLGPVAVTQLGTVNVSGATDIVHTASNESTEAKSFQFTIPEGTLALEIHLENTSGQPFMTLKLGERVPQAFSGQQFGGMGPDETGKDGGVYPTWGSSSLINLANPVAGVYSLTVNASAWNSPGVGNPPADYTIRIHAIGSQDVAFDGSSIAVAEQPATAWRYFRFEVPENALGWDLRLENVTSGLPQLFIRRGELPDLANTISVQNDFTHYGYDSNGAHRSGKIFQAAVGSVIQPGIYYVGVLKDRNRNDPDAHAPMSYTLVSRGIGPDLTIPVQDLAWSGGSISVSDLPPREAAFYRVQVPDDAPGWKVKLSATAGESLLLIRRSVLPEPGAADYYNVSQGKRMQKTGDELYMMLPESHETFIPGGTYYLAVASEGVGPNHGSGTIGTSASSFTLESHGTVNVVQLGSVDPSGEDDLVHEGSNASTEAKPFQFQVPSGTRAVEVRLENRVGNPVMTLRADDKIPMAAQLGSWPSYNPGPDMTGRDGGAGWTSVASTITTIANPVSGTYSLTVNAANLLDTATFPPATYRIRVRGVTASPLNFSEAENTPDSSNTASGTIAHGQRAYYEIQVPESMDGEPIIGWNLDLAQTQGNASMRVRKGTFPQDGATDQTALNSGSTVIVPTFLSPGTWYVEVLASGDTTYTLTSSELELQRPAWNMPAAGAPVTTPGLSGMTFGDTGVDPAGLALPDDGGIDLEQGGFHYYAISVPENNQGLLRTVLEAISGDPDLYIRAHLAPTLNGVPGGSTYERSLTSPGTEYGSWVPLSGRYENGLSPGTWYLAVHADGNSNVRYRLHLSHTAASLVQDLALDGGSFENQLLAGNDWRYYRVQVPVNAPMNWHLTYTQVSGSVNVYIRDTVPPGQEATAESSHFQIAEWADDSKNHGPYPNFTDPGTYTITTPPLRLGRTYYVGVRANVDAAFSISSSVSGETINVGEPVAFYDGVVNRSLEPNEIFRFHVHAPADATRFKYAASHLSSIHLRVEQGTIPAASQSHGGSPGSENTTLNQYLLNPEGWPWMPNQTYYFTVINTAETEQEFSLQMNGKNALTDDDDNDGLLDAWERQYFGSAYTSYNGASDPDNDGVNNATEYSEETNPSDPESANYSLSVIVNGRGTVTESPLLQKHHKGDIVQLTALPADGISFFGWSGHATSVDSPLNLTISTNMSVTAHFGREASLLVRSGDVLGVDYENGDLIRFRPQSGEFSTIAQVGADARMIALGEGAFAGSAWVANPGAPHLVEVDLADGSVSPLPVEFPGASAVVYRNGLLYVGRWDGAIAVISARSGEILHEWSNTLSSNVGYVGMVWDPVGDRLLVTSSLDGAVYSVSKEGVVTQVTTGGPNPHHIAYEKPGQFLIAYPSSVQRLTLGAAPEFTTVANTFSLPVTATPDAIGNIYLGDHDGGHLHRLVSTGAEREDLGDPGQPGGGLYHLILVNESHLPGPSIAEIFGFVSGKFGFTVTGPEGATFVIEKSADLIDWTPFQANALGNGPFHFIDPQSSTSGGAQFYRLRSQ